MQLTDICDHPWFRSNPPIRAVVTLEQIQAQAAAQAEGKSPTDANKAASEAITRQSRNITLDGKIDNVDYQVISKPQHA